EPAILRPFTRQRTKWIRRRARAGRKFARIGAGVSLAPAGATIDLKKTMRAVGWTRIGTMAPIEDHAFVLYITAEPTTRHAAQIGIEEHAAFAVPESHSNALVSRRTVLRLQRTLRLRRLAIRALDLLGEIARGQTPAIIHVVEFRGEGCAGGDECGENEVWTEYDHVLTKTKRPAGAGARFGRRLHPPVDRKIAT